VRGVRGARIEVSGARLEILEGSMKPHIFNGPRPIKEQDSFAELIVIIVTS